MNKYFNTEITEKKTKHNFMPKIVPFASRRRKKVEMA